MNFTTQMLFDFGLHPHYFDDEARVARKIEEVDAQFDLVLIADRFEQIKISICGQDQRRDLLRLPKI